jgi:hypothetical protein
MKKELLTVLAMVVLGSSCGRGTPVHVAQNSSSTSGGLLGSTGYSINVTNNSQDEANNNYSIFQGVPDSGSGPIAYDYRINVVNNSSDQNNFKIYQHDSGAGAASINSGTKDVDLQRAQLQQQEIEDRAQTMAAQFGMNLDAARSLTVISDRMVQLASQNGGMSDEERSELAGAALSVAGIPADDVNSAVAATIQTGDRTAINALMVRAATNLGMSDAETLRTEILPSLGIQIGQ